MFGEWCGGAAWNSFDTMRFATVITYYQKVRLGSSWLMGSAAPPLVMLLTWYVESKYLEVFQTLNPSSGCIASMEPGPLH